MHGSSEETLDMWGNDRNRFPVWGNKHINDYIGKFADVDQTLKCYTMNEIGDMIYVRSALDQRKPRVKIFSLQLQVEMGKALGGDQPGARSNLTLNDSVP